jgi:hypothetical protein
VLPETVIINTTNYQQGEKVCRKIKVNSIERPSFSKKAGTIYAHWGKNCAM